MTCYAEVCLKEFCIDTSLNILLRLEPAQGFGVAAIDSNHGNQILFRDRQDGSRIGVIINTDDMFLLDAQNGMVQMIHIRNAEI